MTENKSEFLSPIDDRLMVLVTEPEGVRTHEEIVRSAIAKVAALDAKNVFVPIRQYLDIRRAKTLSGPIWQLDPHDRMNAKEVLEYVSRNADEFADVIVFGYDVLGELQLRSSWLTREEAAYLLLEALDYVREVGRWKK